ncbi:hypothetical protein [Halorussus lipolyticus]|uniref:hypothetical protein n=1 Tax=Halorussus lipolyticus TaxID=3034024 RepID=UPI0023E8E15C|nr:hypothetical protein [Halorussus sp. DT80]
MTPPTGDGASPAPIDRPILELLRDRLDTTQQVETATITDEGHLELRVGLSDAYYPETVREARLAVRWYENDDFKIHYREVREDGDWECRWDRHRNPHNERDYFHPPPEAQSPGEDASWPTDYREVLRFVLDEIEDRVQTLWRG